MTFARFATAALLTTAALPAAAEDVSYELINNSSHTLVFFYTSPSSDPNWSEDFLGEAVLPPGESGLVTLYGASDICAYDVKFVMDGGQELVDQVDVCQLASYTLTD